MDGFKHPTKFARGSGCYTCRVCKARTRETGEGESHVKLCRKCYDAAGYACDHLDGNHATTKWPDCPMCRDEATAKTEAMPSIPRDALQPVKADRWSVEASTAGFKPGEFPERIKIEPTIGNEQPLRRIGLDGDAVVYMQEAGNLSLYVLND